MSYVDYYEELEDPHLEQQEISCPYGFEFCDDPQTHSMGLCTTECDTYMDEVEHQEREQ